MSAWIAFHKRKWNFQAAQRNVGQRNKKQKTVMGSVAVVRSTASGTLGGFIQRAQRTLLTTPWQILQVAPSGAPGEYKVWVLVSRNRENLFFVYFYR